MMSSFQRISMGIAMICGTAVIVIPASAQKSQEYDVAAIVWPSYHPDDRAKIFWPDGIGEWQTVMSNKP